MYKEKPGSNRCRPVPPPGGAQAETHPDGEYAAGLMEPVVVGLQNLTADDRDALIDYLRALPPIENRIGD